MHVLGQKSYRMIGYYLALAAGPIVLLGRFLVVGQAIYWGVPLLQFIPWQLTAFEQIRSGFAPLWNPLSGMGAPLLANYQLALFYPPTWLLYIAFLVGDTPGLAWANTLVLMLHLGWAGLGMARLIQRLGYGELNQVVGGLAFGLSTFMVARMGFLVEVWVSAWLPWVIWAVSGSSLLMLGLCLAMQFLAGHAQLTWYSLMLAAGWATLQGWAAAGWKRAGYALLRLGAAALLAGALTAVQILPTAEYLGQSQRASEVEIETALTYSFSPYHFLTLIAPNFWGNPGQGNYVGYANYWENAAYVGVMPLVLALSSLILLFRGRAQASKEIPARPIIVWGWAAVALGMILALGKFSPVFPFFFQNVPTFNMFHGPARFLVWVVFGLALLAGIGVENWRAASGWGLYWLRLGTAGASALMVGSCLGILFAPELRPGVAPALALAGGLGLGGGLTWLLLSSRAGEKWKWGLNTALIILIVVDLLAAGWQLNPAAESAWFSRGIGLHNDLKNRLGDSRIYLTAEDEYQLKFNRLFRFSDFGPAERLLEARKVLLPNTNLYEQIPSANNYDPLQPGRYTRWMNHVEGLKPEERGGWLRLMNVGRIEVIDPGGTDGVKFEAVQGGGRLRWIGCAKWADGEAEAWRMTDERVKTKADTPLILEGRQNNSAHSQLCNPGKIPRMTLLNERPDWIKVEVDALEDGYLVVADTWYPGWTAKLDGQPVAVYRADYLFRAAAVPAGQHILEFTYQPAAFYFGSLISLTGWTAVIIIILLRRRKWRHLWN